MYELFQMQITEALPYTFKFWGRPVDGMIHVMKKVHTRDALKVLNIQEEILKFTVVIETNNFLSFFLFKNSNRNNAM